MINLGRPDMVYTLLWLMVVFLSYLLPTNLTVETNLDVIFLILCSMFTFIFSYSFWWWIFSTRERKVICFQDNLEIEALKKFARAVFILWCVFLLINILYSGGIPILWLLMGDSRSYVDFGLPSFTGFSNMFRLFLCSAWALLFIKTKLRKYAWLILLLLISIVVEVSRGGIILALMYILGVITLVYKFSISRIIIRSLLIFTLLLVFIMGFGYLGDLRGSGILVESMVDESSIFNSLPSGFFWVYTYLTSSYNNLNYAGNIGITPSFTGVYTFSTFLPSVIRSELFTLNGNEYPIPLASEAFNATSYFSPMLADFGFAAAAVIVFILQLITCYIYFKAIRGSHFHFMLYPAFFMCLVMSVFYNYYFSLIVLLYPLVIFIYSSYRSNYIRKYSKNRK